MVGTSSVKISGISDKTTLLYMKLFRTKPQESAYMQLAYMSKFASCTKLSAGVPSHHRNGSSVYDYADLR